MADAVSRKGTIRNSIEFELSYCRGARWDQKQGWIDWSGDDIVTTPTTSAFAPKIRIKFTGNAGVLREAGCIDDRMWATMRRALPGTNRGHCGLDCRGQEWSRARRPTANDPEWMTVKRHAKAPDNAWPFHLPGVTELLRADVLREVRRRQSEEKRDNMPSKRVERMIAAIHKDIDPRLADLIGLWGEMNDGLRDQALRAIELVLAGDRLLIDRGASYGTVVPFAMKRQAPWYDGPEPPHVA